MCGLIDKVINDLIDIDRVELAEMLEYFVISGDVPDCEYILKQVADYPEIYTKMDSIATEIEYNIW